MVTFSYLFIEVEKEWGHASCSRTYTLGIDCFVNWSTGYHYRKETVFRPRVEDNINHSQMANPTTEKIAEYAGKGIKQNQTIFCVDGTLDALNH